MVKVIMFSSTTSRISLACLMTLILLVAVLSTGNNKLQIAFADETDGVTEPAPDSIGVGITDKEPFLPESIGLRTENPGPFLRWPLPSSVPKTAISMLPDSPWTHNLLGVSSCPSYPPMIDSYTWDGIFYPGQFNNYALPGTTKDQVRFLNSDNTGLLYNFFACYSASSQFGLPDHAGTDISAANSTSVYAAASANQVDVVIDSAGDYRVRLRHSNVNGTGQTWYTFYVHLSSSLYPVGTHNVAVSAGSPIGGVGRDHLHFQAAIGGNYSNSEARNIWGIDQAPWNGCLWVDGNFCASPPSGCCGCTLANQNQGATAVLPSPFSALKPDNPFTALQPPVSKSEPAFISEIAPDNDTPGFAGIEAPELAAAEPAVPDVTPPTRTLQINDRDVANTLNTVLNYKPPASNSYTLAANVIAAGGGRQSSSNYIGFNTIGQAHQTAVLHSSSYQAHSGFEAFNIQDGVVTITHYVYLPMITKP